jgi:origin recognition complex subunit 2
MANDGDSDPLLDLPDDPELTSEASASHLVSFLTGYDQRAYDASGLEAGSSDEDEEAHGVEEDEDYDEDEEDEDELVATPTKRYKTGLVGTPASRSARSTPRKSKSASATPTPRKKTTLQQAIQSGFIRPSRSDAYFLFSSRPGRTSGNSYSALVRPLSQAEYESHSSAARSGGSSRGIVDDLLRNTEGRWDQWISETDEGFDLLFYGFGSKRRALNRFVKQHLSQRGHCVVVNGHFPGMGIKEVLSQIEDALGVPQDIPVPPAFATPLERSAHRVYTFFLPPYHTGSNPTLSGGGIGKGKGLTANSASTPTQATSSAPLYLVIHNIDSPTLRTPRSLSILSLLASCPRIHLIASFDHIHTPLLFPSSLSTPTFAPTTTSADGEDGDPTHPSSSDLSTPRRFNWIYHNLTTYDDYDLELTYQRLSASSSLSLSTSVVGGGISEEGAHQILRSVPPMAPRLLSLLLTKQLSSLPPDPTSHVAFPANPVAPTWAVDNDLLQGMAREKFIAREEERYNSLMGEFKDHGLVVEAGLDGEGRTGRWVWVPLGKAAVERVLEGMKGVQV